MELIRKKIVWVNKLFKNLKWYFWKILLVTKS